MQLDRPVVSSRLDRELEVQGRRILPRSGEHVSSRCVNFATILFWPAVSAAVVLFAWAAAHRSRVAAFVACLLAAPMFLYLSLTPRFQWTAPVAFALLCVLAWRIRESGPVLIAALALPAVGILIWLVFALSGQ